MSTRPRLLLVSPLPPAWSGVATYTAGLLPHLAEAWEVTLVVADTELPNDVAETLGAAEVIHASSLGWRLEVGSFDRALYCLGNSKAHLHVPPLVAAFGGTVLAHDVRLNALAGSIAQHGGHRHFVSSETARHYGHHLAADIVALESSTDALARFHAVRTRLDRANSLFLGPLTPGADHILVHSEYAARLARLDVRGSCPVGVVPFGHGPSPRVSPTNRIDGPLRVCTFGFAAPEKDLERLVDAVSLVRSSLEVELRIVGHCDPEYERQLRRRAVDLEMSDALVITGRLDDDAYSTELLRADLAVQLRRSANGEASAAIADCMSAGVPTVVSRMGAQAELPESGVEHVAPAVPPDMLCDVLQRILTDSDRWQALATGSAQHAARHSFAHAAGAITEALSSGRPPCLRGSVRSWPRSEIR